MKRILTILASVAVVASLSVANAQKKILTRTGSSSSRVVPPRPSVRPFGQTLSLLPVLFPLVISSLRSSVSG